MDKQELTRLKELAQKAGSGPWQQIDDGNIVTTGDDPKVDEAIGIHAMGAGVFETLVRPNARFIAAANPKTILEMIAEIESLQKQVNDQQSRIDQKQALIDGLQTQEKSLRKVLSKIENRQIEKDQAVQAFEIALMKVLNIEPELSETKIRASILAKVSELARKAVEEMHEP